MLKKTCLAGCAALAAACGVASDGVDATGAELLKPFKMQLQAALKAGLAEGPEQAIDACRVQAPGISADLSVDGVRLGRSSHKLRNPDNVAPEWATGILHGYLREGSDRGPVSVDLDDGRSGYAEPIVIQPVCTVCHGKQIEKGLASTIEATYPDDEATGFEVGDLRGIFWVEYPATR
jgi:hypothetical protein